MPSPGRDLAIGVLETRFRPDRSQLGAENHNILLFFAFFLRSFEMSEQEGWTFRHPYRRCPPGTCFADVTVKKCRRNLFKMPA